MSLASAILRSVADNWLRPRTNTAKLEPGYHLDPRLAMWILRDTTTSPRSSERVLASALLDDMLIALLTTLTRIRLIDGSMRS